jgi:hypothetical protein
MNGNKIMATLVVLTMLLSTLVVLNELNIIKDASAAPVTPGLYQWGDATTDLEYGVTYSNVYVNSSAWAGTAPFYLYYPTYKSSGTGGNANLFTWDGPYVVSGYNCRVSGIANSQIIDDGGVPISFNRSGMWIFDADGTHAGDTPGSYAGYLWVNTSTKYSIDSIANVDYGASGSITITVNTLNDSGCMIAIVNPDNRTIYNKWRTTGVTEAIGIKNNFTLAGDYTVKAYRDFDAQDSTYFYPDEYYVLGGVTENYSLDYGSGYTGNFPTNPSTNPEVYSYTDMGPWDPPEKNANEITFTVNTGKPTVALTNTTIYWGFKARIDVNVTDSKGKGIDVANPIMLKFGSKYVDFSAYITNLGLGNYSIDIPRYNDGPGWKDLATALGNNNVNGTWKVVFGYDANGDDTYEWNNTASFIVKSAKPPVQLTLATYTKKKVDVPAYTPGSGVAPTIDIAFDITGTDITNAAAPAGRAFYGDDPWEDWKNITISGDVLYPMTAATLVHSGGEGRWDAMVTPTQPGGTITITIEWPGEDNGTASQTIEIVNGTHVTAAVDSFTIGSDFNLTITVKDLSTPENPVQTATVYLMWQDVPFEFNSTVGVPGKAGNGKNGEYTFWIPPNSKDGTTPAAAPQNITIAGEWVTGYWGYAKVVMAKNHNMMVNLTPTTSYAGDATEYDIMVGLVGGGHPAKTDLKVALYNSTGALVTGDDAWSKTGSYDITGEELILSGGTYHIFAYNDTADSRGNNATLIITNYTVSAAPSVLAWKIDTDVNMTFTVTPAGNGTLTLNNMSNTPNASDVGQNNQISITDGVGTLEGVNATSLGNVTYDYTPEGGQARHANGLLRITTATATPSPSTVYIGEASIVTITITHPATGTPLKGVRVGLDHGLNLNQSILAKFPTDLHTDAAGQVKFSITTEASGNVTIYIENETDPDNTFVIMSQARKTMTVSTDPAVNEGATFIVSAMSGTTLITDATVTITFAGQTYTTTSGTVSIPAPSVSTSLTYTITATALGYTTATATIMVLNVPKLIIVLPPTTPKGTQTFTITIANDAGQGVAGATVTFNQATYTSGANGLTELKAPDVKDKTANYQITATFTGYADASPVSLTIGQTPGIPGFELLTLVVAIGVAFLLLRRRQKQ